VASRRPTPTQIAERARALGDETSRAANILDAIDDRLLALKD
jgi:hypothetical protein